MIYCSEKTRLRSEDLKKEEARTDVKSYEQKLKFRVNRVLMKELCFSL